MQFSGVFILLFFLQIFEGQKVRYYVLFLLVLPGGTAAYHNGHGPEGDAGGIAPLPFLAPLTLNIFCARTSGMEAFVHKKLTMQGNLPWADNSLFLFFACLLPGRRKIPSPELYYCVKSLRG